MLSRESDHGPFDIIGDVHGCIEELRRLLVKLGYAGAPGESLRPPTGRKALFLGDLVNRGPDVPGVLRLIMSMIANGDAACIAGNHDLTLLQKLEGHETDKEDVLKESLDQLEMTSTAFQQEVISFLRGLPAYLILDEGRLVVAHAGLPAEYHGETSPEARRFAVFGRKIRDEAGSEVRYRFAPDYSGAALVVYGHYSQVEPNWLNGTVCIDTGCVYGGRLTALRYPERELVSVSAARAYVLSRRTEEFRAAALAAGA